jgi:hypothetical protein
MVLGPLLLAGCGLATFQAPPPVPPRASDNARAAACRAQAEEVVNRRERGQLFRNDDRDSREGIGAIGNLRGPADRLGAQFDRDRYIQDCLRAAEPPVAG